MHRFTLRARPAAAAAVRRLSSAQGSSSSSNTTSINTSNLNLNDTRPQETFFGMPPPGSDATTHFGFQTVAQELKEGLVAQVTRGGCVCCCSSLCCCLIVMMSCCRARVD